MDISLAHRDAASNSQARAFLVGAREAAALMPDGGRILALTYSQGSRTGSLQPWVAMGSAKAALESLVRYFAVAVASRGITVNALSSGWTPMKRLGTPADIGDVASLFCSDEAGWITGQTIYADGGASLMNPEVAPELQLS
jgi:enoyl-[acyl-carrier-protein] reductase (NADH)